MKINVVELIWDQILVLHLMVRYFVQRISLSLLIKLSGPISPSIPTQTQPDDTLKENVIESVGSEPNETVSAPIGGDSNENLNTDERTESNGTFQNFELIDYPFIFLDAPPGDDGEHSDASVTNPVFRDAFAKISEKNVRTSRTTKRNLEPVHYYPGQTKRPKLTTKQKKSTKSIFPTFSNRDVEDRLIDGTATTEDINTLQNFINSWYSPSN